MNEKMEEINQVFCKICNNIDECGQCCFHHPPLNNPCENYIPLCTKCLKLIFSTYRIVYYHWIITNSLKFFEISKDKQNSNILCKLCNNVIDIIEHYDPFHTKELNENENGCFLNQECLLSIFKCHEKLFNFWIIYDNDLM